MSGYKYFFLLTTCLFLTDFAHGQWHEITTDWSKNAKYSIGDWGFNRPGYPKGLFIQGITVKTGERVTNPVVYDNDVVNDVLDDEWAFVMASLGLMTLQGYICTPVLTDGWGFSHPEWEKEFFQMRKRAQEAHIYMNRIPTVTIGTEARNEKMGIRKDSKGAQLYLKIIHEQFRKDPTRPVIINIGGQAATLASAWCMDSSIANECIVYYTDLSGYNGAYEWASAIVAKHFRVINFGRKYTWWHDRSCQNEWKVLPRPAHCGRPQRNGRESGEWKYLPHNALMDYFVHQLQWMPWYDATNQKDGHNYGNTSDGYFDGTFIHAWAPGLFTNARLDDCRGGKVIYITAFSEIAAKEATFPILKRHDAYQK